MKEQSHHSNKSSNNKLLLRESQTEVKQFLKTLDLLRDTEAEIMAVFVHDDFNRKDFIELLGKISALQAQKLAKELLP